MMMLDTTPIPAARTRADRAQDAPVKISENFLSEIRFWILRLTRPIINCSRTVNGYFVRVLDNASNRHTVRGKDISPRNIFIGDYGITD